MHAIMALGNKSTKHAIKNSITNYWTFSFWAPGLTVAQENEWLFFFKKPGLQ